MYTMSIVLTVHGRRKIEGGYDRYGFTCIDFEGLDVTSRRKKGGN